MIATVDSSIVRPTLAQAEQANAAGIGMWWGYLATQQAPGSFNLVAPWSQADFDVVLQVFGRAGAFVSGLDDPLALKQLAAAWGIALLALDDEDAIRALTVPDWRPAFLQASAAGLYGVLGRHDIAAPFRIVAGYPGTDPAATWPTSPPPAEPHGWQWAGTHTEFGLSVDRSWLDDWFGGTDMTDEEHAWLQDIHTGMGTLVSSGGPALVYAIKAELDALKAEVEAGGSVDASAAIARIEKALQAA